MVQMRVVTKRDGMERLLHEFPQQVDQIKRDVMEAMAADIALNSPVYTGEYVTNHELRLRSGSFASTKTRPEGAARVSESEAASKRQQGFDNLMRDLASINIKSENFVFRNPMIYANIVEGDYGVYAQARKKAVQAVQEAVERARRRD